METGGRIDLGIGQPDLRLLPLAELQAAADHRFRLGDPWFLQYGPGRGSLPFLEKLAGFLTEGYGIEVNPERLLINGGASHGLDLILSRYTREGDTVFVEDPTYFHALKIFQARHLQVVGIPMDGDGLSVSALEEALQHHQPKLLYTIPVHHNPTGRTLPVERRQRLIELAQDRDFLVVADEVYQLLTYEGSVPPPLQILDPDRVVSLSSFSKVLAPGFRLGWCDARPDRIAELERCGVLRSGGGVSPVVAAQVESALELGVLSEYLERLRRVYRSRARTLFSALKAELHPSIRFQSARGGFFIWIELPTPTDTLVLRDQARAAGSGFLPGALASVDGQTDRWARVSFTYFDEDELVEAVRRLAPVLNGCTVSGRAPL